MRIIEYMWQDAFAGRLNIAAKALEGKDYLMSKTFTVADAYLFTVLRWSPRMNVVLSPWPVLQAYMERIAARPAIKPCQHGTATYIPISRYNTANKKELKSCALP